MTLDKVDEQVCYRDNAISIVRCQFLYLTWNTVLNLHYKKNTL